MKNLLLIAYHFPPIQGSSGVHRTLAFARYLLDFGWRTTVLTVQPRAYDRVREVNSELIPGHVRVERAFALDTQKHLSIMGKYPRFLAMPDRWQSWVLGGTLRGLRVVRRDRPAAIMSTFPVASAHLVGAALSRYTGLPWVADFRDPMAQPDYPADPAVRRGYWWVESKVFARAARVTVTTPGAAKMYHERYDGYPEHALRVIPNGYDEGVFAGIEGNPAPPSDERPVELLHSGILYPVERDPRALFEAIAELKRDGKLSADALRLRLRAAGNEVAYGRQLADLGITDIVQLEPPLDYRAALAEMLSADGLLLCQSASCNGQIPAKLYEYLYARRPVLTLADPRGDTGGLMVELGNAYVAALEDKEAIKVRLLEFLTAVRAGACEVPGPDAVKRYSRRERTAELAELLDGMVDERRSGAAGRS